MSKFSHSKPRILLGVTGSIAAYKAVELIGLLKTFSEVKVVLTLAGSHLVPKKALARASGSKVWTSLFEGSTPIPPGTPSGTHPLAVVPHIEYAKDADLLLIAPASADILSKLALGIADDLLSTLSLYASCPLWVAPAMNARMWNHPAVVHNRKILEERKVRFLGPDSGHLACGEVGDGRFAEPSEIAHQVEDYFKHFGEWKGKKVLVTAGPTRENIDPVRMITNRSSGKMGYALAQAALNRGAEVTLISGPTRLIPPPVTRLIWVENALEMRRHVKKNLATMDIVIMAAAVSDFRAKKISKVKIKKGMGELSLRLEKNPDILAEILRLKKPRQFFIGFAAETKDLGKNALEKWKSKPCDLMVANRVGKGETGFDSDLNELLVFKKGNPQPIRFQRDLKSRLAEKLLNLV